jgi:endonuclease YncB( thermonuclease family)
MIRTATIIAALALATPALADPCEAIPKKGPKPTWIREGVPLTGRVTYLGDGDGLCFAARPGGSSGWVEVRLADYRAAELHQPGGKEAKAQLERIAMGKRVICTPVRGDYGSIWSWDRVVAVCTVNGRSVGDLMRGAGVVEGGNGR